MAKKNTATSEVSEAEIAVHWQEEGYYPAPVSFIAQANMTDANVHKRFSAGEFPRLLQGICGSADLVQILGHDPRYQQRAVLALVRRRQDERLL